MIGDTAQCQTCSTVSMGNDETRLRVLGWRIWSGTTIGGQESSVTFCPACMGEGGVNAEGEAEGWHAHCQTCAAEMCDDMDDDGPWTEKDAKDWKRDHDCEPDVVIEAPDRVKAGRA